MPLGLKAIHGWKEVKGFLDEYNRAKEYDALVVKTSAEINQEDEFKQTIDQLDNNTYRVDIYPNGVITDADGNITNDPAYSQILAFTLYKDDLYVINQFCTIRMFEGYALIAPPRIPSPGQQYTVLEVFDQYKKIKWDGVRFLNYLNTTFLDV